VINISNYTSKDNPPWPAVQVAITRPLDRPDVTDRTGGRPRLWRIRIVLDWLADLPRRWGDRWFAMNDAEAQWRGWQMTRVHGGLGRRYRDPRFATLAECAWCRGAGLHADAPCTPCLGTGRVTIRGVS
jgi:hypothetical protein